MNINNSMFSLRLNEEGENYSEYVFYVLPEQVDISTPARLALYQSINGQTHADHMGDGTTTINLQGVTGWMLGGLMNSGFAYASYVLLREMIFRYYKKCKEGESTSTSLKLTISFPDAPDYGQWDVAIRELTLRRSASAPLMFNYQLSMVCLSGNYLSNTANEKYPNQQQVMQDLKSNIIPDSVRHIFPVRKEMISEIEDAMPGGSIPINVDLTEMIKVAEARFSDTTWILGGSSILIQTEQEQLVGSGSVQKYWNLRQLAGVIFGTSTTTPEQYAAWTQKPVEGGGTMTAPLADNDPRLLFLARENPTISLNGQPSKSIVKRAVLGTGDSILTSVQENSTITVPTMSFDNNYKLNESVMIDGVETKRFNRYGSTFGN